MYDYYLKKLLCLLALEYNCEPEDFLKDTNVLTASRLQNGGRNYSGKKYFFSMVTLGKNTVVTADETMLPFLSEYINRVQGHWLFEFKNLFAVNDELKKHGYELSSSHHMLLACKTVSPYRQYPVKWFFDREIDSFYGDKRFSHALCEKYLPDRPDRIAVCAYDHGNIMGMAGCSEDAPHWLQIGIDVLPEYRSRGVGTYLVTLLKNEIIKRGDIPFYGSAVGNYHSQNIAINSGFKPTWAEIEAKQI